MQVSLEAKDLELMAIEPVEFSLHGCGTAGRFGRQWQRSSR